eukprot:jgi/Bigna1/52477/estExt_Genewise1Plus.C_80138
MHKRPGRRSMPTLKLHFIEDMSSDSLTSGTAVPRKELNLSSTGDCSDLQTMKNSNHKLSKPGEKNISRKRISRSVTDRANGMRPSIRMIDVVRNSSWTLKNGTFKGGGVEISPSFLDHGTGQMVSGRDIVRLWDLGKGQNRAVWAGIHLPTFQLVAIKTADLELTSPRHQFTNELRILSVLKHKNVIRLHGAHIAGGMMSAILELMNGGSLEQFSKRHGAMDETQLASVAKYSLRGIAYMHKRLVVHGDIKPANILMNNDTIKITDFGIARAVPGPGKSIKSESGTILYMSPEQHLWKQMSSASDIWSFGLTILSLATGKPPYEAKDYWEMLDQITEHDGPSIPENMSNDFKDFLGKCLRKNPSERATAAELLEHPFLSKAQHQSISTMAAKNRDSTVIETALTRLHTGIANKNGHSFKKYSDSDSIKENDQKIRRKSATESMEAFMQALSDTLTAALRKVKLTKDLDLSSIKRVEDVSEEHLRRLIVDQMGFVWEKRFVEIWNNQTKSDSEDDSFAFPCDDIPSRTSSENSSCSCSRNSIHCSDEQKTIETEEEGTNASFICRILRCFGIGSK